MNQHEYQCRIAKTVRLLRILNRLKQREFARELCLDRSAYTRLESGERCFNIAQLKAAAGFLKVPIQLLILISESDLIIEFDKVPISEAILRLVDKVENKEVPDESIKSEAKFLITLLQERLLKDN